MTTHAAEYIELKRIRSDGGTQMRAGLSQDTINEYVQALEDAVGAWPFPPVIAYYDGEVYWLADGFHRVAAVKQHERNAAVLTDVRSGSRRDAILHAAGANANHGLRRTNADKRRAVETLLRDQEWARWSDGEIAKRCQVSDRFVAAIRKELSPNGSEIPTERIVTRGTQTYMQNTANVGKTTQTIPNPARFVPAVAPVPVMPTTPSVALPAPEAPPTLPVALNAAYAPLMLLKAKITWWLRSEHPQYEDQIASLRSMMQSLDGAEFQRLEPTLRVPYRREDVIEALRQVYAHIKDDDEPEPEATPVEPEPATPVAMPVVAPVSSRLDRFDDLRYLFGQTLRGLTEFAEMTGRHVVILPAKRHIEDIMRLIDAEIESLEGGDPVRTEKE